MTEEKAPKAPKTPKVPKAPKAPKIKAPEQNGVSRPKAGSTTEKVWVISETLTASAGSTASRADVVAAARLEGINEATAATQYGRWRKFNGIIGTVSTPKPEVVPAAITTDAEATAEADAGEDAESE